MDIKITLQLPPGDAAWWWAVAAVLLIGGVAALVAWLVQRSRYESLVVAYDVEEAPRPVARVPLAVPPVPRPAPAASKDEEEDEGLDSRATRVMPKANRYTLDGTRIVAMAPRAERLAWESRVDACREGTELRSTRK